MKYNIDDPISIKEILPRVEDEKQLIALTGVNLKLFMLLLMIFKEVTIEHHKKTLKHKKDANNRKITLEKTAEKLFFVLYYLKSCPALEILGFTFDMDGSLAFKQVKNVFPLLIETLNRFNVLSEASFETPEEMQLAFANIKALLIDATERVINLENLAT